MRRKIQVVVGRRFTEGRGLDICEATEAGGAAATQLVGEVPPRLSCSICLECLSSLLCRGLTRFGESGARDRPTQPTAFTGKVYGRSSLNPAEDLISQ